MKQTQKTMILTLRIKAKYLLTAFTLASLVIPLGASAQPSVSLSVSPTIFEMNANPGQTWESSMRIINNNPFELTVYAEVVNFRPLGEDGRAQFIPVVAEETNGATLGEWISVPKSALVVPAEQTLEIPIRIELPEDAGPGGHYAAVLVGTRPPPDRTEATRVETSQVVSSLIFLRVAGDIVEDASIRSFRPLSRVVERPEVDFELRFENHGNVHVRPEGEIVITNMWGQERGVIPVNRKTLFGNVLSESIRSYNFAWEGEWSPLDIGRYKAEAVLGYGEDARQFASAETTFWLIPWKILLGIFIVIGLITFIITWLVRLYIRRMLAIAGLEDKNPLQRTIANDRRRHVSVVAPIEAGILDLRSRFSSDSDSKITMLTRFVLEYRMFFIGIAAIGLVLYLIIWFAGTVSDSDRAYEVKISGAGEEVIVDSESLVYEEQQTQTVVAKRDIPPLTLVNRSGVNGAAARVAFALEELGYTIDEVSADLNAVQERTVIVFDPALSDEAVELGEILNGALPSPFASEEPNKQTITVYIGTDISGL